MMKWVLPSAVLMNFVLFAGTKKVGVIANFSAKESPDSVTLTWTEKPDEKTRVKAVRIQRRIVGATEEEAWEFVGGIVPGGVEALTVEGFTLDKSYEYRGVYVVEVDE